MQVDSSAGPRGAGLGLALALAVALAGCATPAPATPAPPAAPAAAMSPAPAPAAAAAAPAPALVAAPAPVAAANGIGGHPADAVLAYADRVRNLAPAELAQEIQRLGDGSYSPEGALQLALALAQGRNGSQLARAQGLVQRVQQDPQARALHPLARLLGAQLAEHRRLDEAADRQSHQLRDAQRRIDQLNERLEAVRAIERSLPSRPRRDPPLAAPRPAQRASAP